MSVDFHQKFNNVEFDINGDAIDLHRIDLVETELNGGKISREKIDTIKGREHYTSIIISGLYQDTFNYFIENYGQKFKRIELWKSPRVHDLSCLGTLHNLEEIDIWWNQKAERLWDFSENKKLKLLTLSDFVKLKNFDDLVTAHSVEIFNFSSGQWKPSEIDSLEPISKMENLHTFGFSYIKIKDGKAAPLLKMKKLRELSFAVSQFSTEQVAWMKARIPNIVTMPAYVEIGYNTSYVTGSRKPSMLTSENKDRLAKYQKKYDDLVKHYTENPHIEEPE